SSPPTELAGEWSGNLELGGQQVSFQFHCTPDGKVRYGMLGQMTPDLHAGLVGRPVGSGEGEHLEEFQPTAATCRVTIRTSRAADIQFHSDDVRDFSRVDAQIQRFTFVIRRVGDEVEVEMTEQLTTKEGTGQPATARGRLRRS